MLVFTLILLINSHFLSLGGNLLVLFFPLHLLLFFKLDVS